MREKRLLRCIQWDALAMVQRLSETTWRTFRYRLWILERLWELTCPISVPDCYWDVCCWWSDSWRSLRLRSDWTFVLRSALTFFACCILLSMFLITSAFVLTKLATSSISASRSVKSRVSSSFCSFGFWNAVPTRLCSFCKFWYTLWRYAKLCWSPEDCFCFPTFFFFY